MRSEEQIKSAFEAKYSSSAEDPACAEELRLFRDGWLARAPDAGEADVWPIVRVVVKDDKIVSATQYAPGLPDGEHDVYPVRITRPEDRQQYAKEGESYVEGVNVERLAQAMRALGMRSWDSLEEAPTVMSDAVNRLTRNVIKYVLTPPPATPAVAVQAEPAFYLSSKQLPLLPTVYYFAYRMQAEGNFDTPVYFAHPKPAAQSEAPVAWGIRRKGAKTPHMITFDRKVAEHDINSHAKRAELTESENSFEFVELFDHPEPAAPATADEAVSDEAIDSAASTVWEDDDDDMRRREFARKVLALRSGAPATADDAVSAITDEQIEAMVSRFLSWKLPANFSPDCGISFKRVYNEASPFGTSIHEPSGTNLFDAEQARAMIEYIVAIAPAAGPSEDKIREIARRNDITIEAVRAVLALRSGASK